MSFIQRFDGLNVINIILHKIIMSVYFTILNYDGL
jgi:hypothetical protein